MTCIFLICFITTLLHYEVFAFPSGIPCFMRTSVGNLPGVCISIRQCQAAISDISAGLYPTVCGKRNNDVLVCCPTAKRISAIQCQHYEKRLTESEGKTLANPLLPISYLSSYQSQQPKKTSSCTPRGVEYIVSGRNSIKDEFPHMAALGYTTSNVDGTPNYAWRCGATIISEQFLLTAAHCVTSGRQPAVVLVGDIYLSPVNNKQNSARQIYPIQEILVHPEYKPPMKYHDIGIIKINGNISLSKSTRPACLPQPDERLDKFTKVEATGWGLLEFGGQPSNILQTVDLEKFSRQDCDKVYNNSPERKHYFPQGMLRSQICVGDPKELSDTCQGDSGGPIVLKKSDDCFFYIVGITSFGSRYCGYGDPGIYTNVHSYLDWIEGKVWGNQ